MHQSKVRMKLKVRVGVCGTIIGWKLHSMDLVDLIHMFLNKYKQGSPQSL